MSYENSVSEVLKKASFHFRERFAKVKTLKGLQKWIESEISLAHLSVI